MVYMERKRKPAARWRKLAAGIAAVTTIGAGGMGVYKSLPYFIGEKVERVVDGDTFILSNNQAVKLYGVDSPEPENCYGGDSAEYLKKLLAGKRVFLREPVTDVYRRIVALVYLDRKLVNEMVIRQGYGLYTRSGESETKAMSAANRFAREHSLGIFGPECYQGVPPDPKCNIKGNYDRSKNEWVYIRPDCSYYTVTMVEKFKGERWFCTETEAVKAGFTKFAYCK